MTNLHIIPADTLPKRARPGCVILTLLVIPQVYCNGKVVDQLIGADEVPVVVQKIKHMIKMWTEAPDTTTLERSSEEAQDVAKVVSSYSPTQSPVSAKVEGSVPAGDECGEEGCEIVWD